MTAGLQEKYGDRIYVPDLADLRWVLGSLIEHRDERGYEALFKVGFEEEDLEGMVKLPYVSGKSDLVETMRQLSKFNLTQDLGGLENGGIAK